MNLRYLLLRIKFLLNACLQPFFHAPTSLLIKVKLFYMTAF
jgi:hypothetical protein